MKILAALTGSILIALVGVANAQDPPFLEWSIQMNTPRLQSGHIVQLKNQKKPGKFLAEVVQATIDILHAGINLVWHDKVQPGRTDVRFEIENPGMTTPKVGPVTWSSKVAIKVGAGGKFGGYLKCQDTRFGIDMNFSQVPAYEWHVINMAPAADGIGPTHKIALLNTKKSAFLVYQSRRIGFELGWWRYFPPLPSATGGNAAMAAYKTNIAQILPFLNQLDKINPSQSRFLRNFFNIKRTA